MWTTFTIIIAIVIIWRIFFKTKVHKNSEESKGEGKRIYTKKAYASMRDEASGEYQELSSADVSHLFISYKDRLQAFRDEEQKITEIVRYVAATGDIEGLKLEEYREIAKQVERVGEEAQDLLFSINFGRDSSEDKFQKVVDNISDLAGDIVQDIEEHISDIEDIVAAVHSGYFSPDDFEFLIEDQEKNTKITSKSLFKGTKIPKKPKDPSYEILYANSEGKKNWWKISIHSKHTTDRFEAWVYKADEVVSLSFRLDRILLAHDLNTGKTVKDFSLLLEGVPLMED